MNFNKNNQNKRHGCESSGALYKRQKYTKIDAIIRACFQVSYRNYLDYSSRFLIIDPPSCVTMTCRHQHGSEGIVRGTPSYIVDSFQTEFKNKLWYEALELCRLSLTSTQYLSSEILKNVVKIMLNAHEDETSEYSVDHILDRCQQILIENFKRHPPCVNKALRDCYEKFLTSSITTQNQTFADRSNTDKNILKYCISGLNYDLFYVNTEGPIVNPPVPKNITDMLRESQWRREELQIFETLNREQRIERMFTVLEVLIILLQFDLAISNARSININERRSKCQKKLLDSILWPEIKSTVLTKLNEDCRDILKIYAHIIHHQYPERIIKIMTTWVNAIIQAFYMQDTHASSNYPNTSSYCSEFVNEFFKIISEKPNNSINRILERIEPMFMRYAVGLQYLHKMLGVNEACVITILIDFINASRWNKYITDSTKIPVNSFCQSIKVDNKLNHLLENYVLPNTVIENTPTYYGKHCNKTLNNDSIIIQAFYTTLEAYLNAYGIRQIREIYIRTHNADARRNPDENMSPQQTRYSVTKCWVETNISKILHLLETLMDLLRNLKLQGKLPIELTAIEQLVIYTCNLQ